MPAASCSASVADPRPYRSVARFRDRGCSSAAAGFRTGPTSRRERNYRRFNLNAHTAEEARRRPRRRCSTVAPTSSRPIPGLTLDQMRAITDEAHRRGKRVGAHVYTDEEIRVGDRRRASICSTTPDPGIRIRCSRRDAAADGAAADSHRAIDRAPGGALSRAPCVAGADSGSVACGESSGGLPIRSSNRSPVISRRSATSAKSSCRCGSRPPATRQLVDAGCRVIMGTDSGTPGLLPQRGRLARGRCARADGRSHADGSRLSASTRLAAQALGVNAGVVHPGRLADLILVRGNPLENMIVPAERGARHQGRRRLRTRRIVPREPMRPT